MGIKCLNGPKGGLKCLKGLNASTILRGLMGLNGLERWKLSKWSFNGIRDVKRFEVC